RFKKPGPLYNKLAVIVLNQRHDYARAEELLKKALEQEPDNAVYQQNLFKVVGLAASAEKKEPGGGFFSRLRRGR
ncbi:MAG: tetratricopeptide repeat protein, partial [Myxococcaceae bacterium]